MTAQIAEVIHYQGRQVEMWNEPLFDYFALQGIDPGFEAPSAELRRGYLGTWEISDDCLYLIGIQANLMDGTEADLLTLFPHTPGRVFAVWYSGTLRLRDDSKEVLIDLVCGMVRCLRPLRPMPAEMSAPPDEYVAQEVRTPAGDMRR